MHNDFHDDHDHDHDHEHPHDHAHPRSHEHPHGHSHDHSHEQAPPPESLARYTVSMDARLLAEFDALCNRRGYQNRSEAVRDLIRNALVEDQWTDNPEKTAATVTLVYDHHQAGLSERLTEIQHRHTGLVVSTTHVHLDNSNCLEVIILRGQGNDVRKLAEELVAQKGVKHGKSVLTTEGQGLY
jgi:CopG family nickel-responsive transcriptional regulator